MAIKCHVINKINGAPPYSDVDVAPMSVATSFDGTT